MQKTIIAAVFITLCCAISFAEDIELPHITVYGTAITKVTPDQMLWNLSVKNTGGSVQKVAQEHTKIVESVLRFLKEQKVPDKEIQTARMTFQENWVYKKDTSKRIEYRNETRKKALLAAKKKAEALAPGKIKVQMKVKVVFRLITHE